MPAPAGAARSGPAAARGSISTGIGGRSFGRRAVLAAQVVLQVVMARLQAVVDDVVAESRPVRIGVDDPDDDRRAAVLDRPGLELASRASTSCSILAGMPTVDFERERGVVCPRRRAGGQGRARMPDDRPQESRVDRRIASGLLGRAGCGA